MGSPHNSDDHVVAVWFQGKAPQNKLPWRMLVGGQKDPTMVVFRDDVTILPTLTFSQTNFFVSMSDAEIIAEADRFENGSP